MKRFIVCILIWLMASSAHCVAEGMRGAPGGDAAAESPERPEPPRDIAFITFETLPADVEDNQWIGAGFSESLSAKIAAAEFPSLNVYERRMLAKTLRTAGVSQTDVSGAFTGGDTAAVAKVTQAVRAAGVELIVIGSVQVAGPWNAPDTKFEFNGVVVDTTTGRIEEGRAISFSGFIGKGGAELFTSHSALAREVIAALDIDPASAKQPNKLGEPETDNIDAYRHYILGLAARDAGDFEGAIAHFEQATAVSESFIKALLAKGDTYKEMYEAASAPQKAQVGETWETKARDDDRLLTAAAQLNLACSLISRCENENLPDKCTEALAALDMFDAMNANSSYKLENVTDFKFFGGALFVNTVIIDEYGDFTYSVFVALDIKTGNELWRFEIKSWIRSFNISGGAVFVHTVIRNENGENRISGGLVALDEKTGKELWRFKTEGRIDSFELSGGAVFVHTYIDDENGENRISDGLVALDEKTGNELWRFKLEGWVGFSFEISDGAVFVDASIYGENADNRISGGLVALDEKTGNELWRFETEEEIGSFEISGGAVFVEASENAETNLVALDEKTGNELWRFKLEGWVCFSFEISDSTVFVKTYTGDLNQPDNTGIFALDEKTGNELWRFVLEGNIHIYELSGGTVFVKTYVGDYMEQYSHKVTALDERTGNELWRFEPESGINVFEISDGTVFASLSNGGIAMIDARTGASTGNILDGDDIWQFIVYETKVYAASGNKLFEYNLKTHTLEGMNETDGDIDMLEISEGMISAWTRTYPKGFGTFYVFSPSSGGAAVDNTAAMLSRAEAELFLGNHEKAKETLLALVALKPGMMKAWQLLFNACEKAGDVFCMNTAFINIHFRAPGISGYDEIRDAWIRRTPFSETGTDFVFRASKKENNIADILLLGEKQEIYYDGKTGKEPWRFKMDGEIYSFDLSGVAMFVRTNNRLAAFDEKTGIELWRFEPEGEIGSFELSGGAVFVNTYVGDFFNPDRAGLTALDEKTGKELWRFKLDRVFDSFKLSGGTALVNTYNRFEALDEKTGKELWRFEPEGGIGSFKVSGGAVFVNTYVGDFLSPDLAGLTALDEKTGKELWRFVLHGAIYSFKLSGETAFVNTYVGDFYKPDLGCLFALDEKTGKELWRFKTEGRIESFELSGGAVFVRAYIQDIDNFYHAFLVALDEKTGKELWRFDPENVGSFVLSGGVVFALAYIHTGGDSSIHTVLTALDEKTGKELWRFESKGWISSFKLSGGAVFASTYAGDRYTNNQPILVALDEKTGKELWQCDFDKATIENFARAGDNLFIQISLPSAGSMVLVMDMNKAKQMVADGKKWW